MSDNRKLIGTAEIDEIVETAVLSAWLTDAIPVSIVLIGPSGSGRSKTLLQYEKVSGLHRSDDVTSSGLYDIVSKDKDNKVNHLLIGDFNTVLSHKGSTSYLTVASLLSLMADGVARIDDGRETKSLQHVPMGILTAMTNEMYRHHAKKFFDLGFLRRFLAIHFDYSESTRSKVMEGIRNHKVTLEPLTHKPIVLPKTKTKQNVKLTQNLILETLSPKMAYNLSFYPARTFVGPERKMLIKMVPGKPALEFTPYLVLQVMARAHALRDERPQVNLDDIEFLRRMVDFTNPMEPKKI